MHLDYTPISEDSPFFDFCRKDSNGMYKFILNIEKDNDFINSTNDFSSLDAFDYFDNHNCRIVIMVFLDIIKCCQQMEIDDEVPHLASIYFRMLFSQLYWNDDTQDLFYIDSDSELSANNAFRILSNIQNESESPFDFTLSYCLERHFGEPIPNYKFELYKFTSLLAPDKNTRTTAQSYFLECFEKNILELCDDYDNTTSEENVEQNTEDTKIQPLESLSQLIGLNSVKVEVSKLANFVKIQQFRIEKGLKTTPISYHCVFTGNPGTGKTTVARILASIYKDFGILAKGHLVETDRSGLVAEYVGQTAVKTNSIIDSALDGVLFIDEAYSLVAGDGNDFGHEAIATLLKRMEDDRSRLVVILAGYSDKMKIFLDSNPGLRSRFTRYIHFDDYNLEELVSIFMYNMKKNEYNITPEALESLREKIKNTILHKDKNFGNARYVRNLFEKVLEQQAVRLANEIELTTESLQLITNEDIK